MLDLEQSSVHFQEIINSSRRIYLTSHVNTDADDLGAALGLYHTLAAKSIHSHIILQTPPSKQLGFLPGIEVTENILPNDLTERDTVVIFGCSDLKRTGLPELNDCNATIVNMDHHPDNALFGQLNVVDASVSAAAEIAFRLLEAGNWPIPQEAATAFACGIISDTGGFQFSNTNASTLSSMSSLMRLGANPAKIFRKISKHRAQETEKAWLVALTSAHHNEKLNCVTTVITDTNQYPSGVFDGVTDFLNRTQGSGFTFLLRQEKGYIKASLRSTPSQGVDVGQLARSFGGGGHKYASGFSLPGRLQKSPSGMWDVAEESDKVV